MNHNKVLGFNLALNFSKRFETVEFLDEDTIKCFRQNSPFLTFIDDKSCFGRDWDYFNFYPSINKSSYDVESIKTTDVLFDCKRLSLNLCGISRLESIINKTKSKSTNTWYYRETVFIVANNHSKYYVLEDKDLFFLMGISQLINSYYYDRYFDFRNVHCLDNYYKKNLYNYLKQVKKDKSVSLNLATQCRFFDDFFFCEFFKNNSSYEYQYDNHELEDRIEDLLTNISTQTKEVFNRFLVLKTQLKRNNEWDYQFEDYTYMPNMESLCGLGTLVNCSNNIKEEIKKKEEKIKEDFGIINKEEIIKKVVEQPLEGPMSKFVKKYIIDPTDKNYIEEKGEEKMDNKIENTLTTNNNFNANAIATTTSIPTLNILGQSVEFGIVQDPNIASTMLGLSVKVGNNWRVFDKEKKTITDVMGLQLGNFPIMIMPSNKLNVGDLIKENGEYLYVTEVNPASVKTLNVNSGIYQEISPVQNLFGINFYSKLLTFEDKFKKVIGTNGGFDAKSLLMLGMLSGGFDTNVNRDTNPNNMFNNMDLQSMLMLSLMLDGLGDDSNGLFGSLFGDDEDKADYESEVTGEVQEIVFTNGAKKKVKKSGLNSIFGSGMSDIMKVMMMANMLGSLNGSGNPNTNMLGGSMQNMISMVMLSQILK